MINHTMIVSFDVTVPEADVDQFLADMKGLVLGSGGAQTFASARNVHVPADDHSPVFAASAIVQLGLTDLDALNAAFTLPGLEEFIGDWQSRYPYKVVWANHAPLS